MKGIVKIIKTQPTPNSFASGTVQESGTTNQYSFNEAGATPLGIQVGTKVTFEVAADISGTNVAYSLRSLEKGVIQTVNAPDSNNVITGTLAEVSTGSVLQYAQVDFPSGQIVAGVKVGYDAVTDPASGATVAVSLISA